MPLADRAALAISAAASPFVTIFAFALGIIVHYSRSTAHFLWLGGPFVLLIIALPFVWIAIGVRMGRFTDMHVMHREQRGEPFVVATLGAVLLVATYLAIGAPYALTVLAVNLVVNGVLLALLTSVWKVSVHAAAFSAGVLAAALLVDFRLIALLAAVPLIVWARIRRKRHSLAQGVGAAALTMLTTWLTCFLMGAR